MEIQFSQILKKFIVQAQKGELKTSSYPKSLDDLITKVSFGMGTPARIPWIAFISPEMKVSKGFYPVYLYYKEQGVLILSYGISETGTIDQSWPIEIINNSKTIESYFDQKVPRYGDSFVFKSYKVILEKEVVSFKEADSEKDITDIDLDSDLNTILSQYKKIVNIKITTENSTIGQGLFYMEKQLEDFLIHNWENTELGKKYNLIIEEGELLSQQYPTDIGPIDILAKEKATNCYVVIELKKNQTSDDTIGQIARYMGWVKTKMNDDKVKGIIIAGTYDKKLDFALKMVPNVEVYLYEVSFKLRDFQP